jgi:hypothetical protein
MSEIFLILFLSFAARDAANEQVGERLLDTKVEEANPQETFERLIEMGLVSRSALPAYAMMLVDMLNESRNLDTLTVRGMIDEFERRRAAHDEETMRQHDFGPEPFYIRTPAGDRVCLGRGAMSFEALVMREAERKFPRRYGDAAYNKTIAEDVEFYANTLSAIAQADVMGMMLAGSALIVLGEAGVDTSAYRIGDVIEIGRRVKDSEEFAPFLKIISENFN